VVALAKGITVLGLAPKAHEEEPHKLGIFATNCPEWSMTWLAMQRISAAIVTLYATLGESSLAFCVKQSELSTICCD
jgi:long-subunit acyl-CoA synthetase (AMP-forming)